METASRCSTSNHLVVIGNGMASHRVIEALARHPQRPSHITVIGQESVPAYNRILLSPLLAGEMQHDALTLRDQAWYAEHDVTLRLGVTVTAVDPAAKCIKTHSGDIHYDQLVLATGSRPALPAVPGITLTGVHSFRNIQDAAALEEIALRGGNVVVIGGGLLGLEAAEGLRKRGGDALNVSVLQRSDRLMNRQLDTTAAQMLESALDERGLTIVTNAQLAAIEDDAQGHVQGVTLSDGRRLKADSVIVAAGITPNSALGQAAGLTCDRAIVVDGYMTTSSPDIFALGECCQFEQHTYGLVEPIWRQVDVLAAVLCGDATASYQEAPTATKLKVSGVALYAFGPTQASSAHDVLHYHDQASGDYRRLLLRDGRIEGAVLYGDTRHGPWYFDQALAATDMTACRQALLFGPADADVLQAAIAENATPSSHQPTSEAA